MSNQPLSLQYYEAGIQWADLHAAASLLEEGRSAYLSQLMGKHLREGTTMGKADILAKSSDDWINYNERMVESRRKANIQKVTMEFLRVKFWESQSHAATERTQARL